MDVKKRFKLYKSGKRWVALALLFGGTAFFIETNQTVANADESVAQTSVQSEPDNSLQGQTDTILQEKAGTSIMFRNTATSSFGERRAIAEAADISWSCLLPDPMQNASRLAVITGTKIRIRFMAPEVKPFRSLITSGITARTTVRTTTSTDLMTWEEAKILRRVWKRSEKISPQIEKPDDLQSIANHPVFCVCATIERNDGNNPK